MYTHAGENRIARRYKNRAVGRGRLAKGGVLMLTLLFLLCGCGGAAPEEIVAGKTYTYTGESFSKIEDDLFRITIEEDGTFSYGESAFSSYLGMGTWRIEGDTLILTDDAQIGYALQNVFRIEGEELAFVEEDSTNFLYIKVKDGEHFVCTGDTGM